MDAQVLGRAEPGRAANFCQELLKDLIGTLQESHSTPLSFYLHIILLKVHILLRSN